MSYNTLPAKQGLYDPINEHDACGVGFIAHIKGNKSNHIIVIFTEPNYNKYIQI